MGNIEFSKAGEAILTNKVLTDHISHRLSNLQPSEMREGRIEVKLKGGRRFYFRFGPTMESFKTALAVAK